MRNPVGICLLTQTCRALIGDERNGSKFCEKTGRVKKEMHVTGSSLEKIIFSITEDRQKEVHGGQSEDTKWSDSSHKTCNLEEIRNFDLFSIFQRYIA
jgi:hypothetical protein